MKDIIADRLNRVSNLDDRRLLKNILFDVYENIIDYNLSMYERLEKRLYDEIDVENSDNYAVYTSMAYLEDIDPVSDFLHPIIPGDADIIIDLNDVREKIRENEPVVIATVFMKCDNTMISEITEENNMFKGIVKTNRNTYEITAKAKPCRKYIRPLA